MFSLQELSSGIPAHAYYGNVDAASALMSPAGQSWVSTAPVLGVSH